MLSNNVSVYISLFGDVWYVSAVFSPPPPPGRRQSDFIRRFAFRIQISSDDDDDDDDAADRPRVVVT